MKRTHGGRPPLDDHEPSGHVGLTLPLTQLDRYIQRALREDVSVPEIIRRDLSRLEKKSKNP